MGLSPAITLTTDFGTADGYTAAMKGVLLAKAPGMPLIDLSHDVAPFDRMGAFLLLRQAVPQYPEGTVHLYVVDPGVGTMRRGLIVRANGQTLVGPDNGVLPALFPAASVEAFAIAMEHFPNASPTFHGRDVFAPVAAALAMGGDPQAWGTQVTDAERIGFPLASRLGNIVKGEVIHIDRYGNLITNVARRALQDSSHVAVSINRNPVKFGRTYGDVLQGEAVAYWGSGGLLEIGVREGRAADRFGGKGLAVEVVKYA